MTSVPSTNLAHPFDTVKPSSNNSYSHSPRPMIHHSKPFPNSISGNRKVLSRETGSYGVSRTRRLLSPELLRKKHDHVWSCLAGPLGLTLAQREVTMRLLRLWAYYGLVYPKESTITEDPGCSKATFWRTIGLLKDRGLVTVINRHLTPFRRQTSNIYRLDKLVMLIARYLAEHGTAFLEKWLRPYLAVPGVLFWGLSWSAPPWPRARGPGGLYR